MVGGQTDCEGLHCVPDVPGQIQIFGNGFGKIGLFGVAQSLVVGFVGQGDDAVIAGGGMHTQGADGGVGVDV